MPPAAAPRRPITRVTKGTGTLPNDHGQVWREYDITPYTLRVTSTNQPEQAVVDWILRETGYETWHSEPLGLLSANQRTLTVYHTPEIQALVHELVDRFVCTEAESHVFNLRIMTLSSPNWRAKALPLMTPVPVQSQGVQAWLMARENAALLLSGLRKRADYREHGAPQMAVNNGQSIIVSTVRPRTYVRGVVQSSAAWPGYNPDVAQLEEGYSLEFAPLLSLDGTVVDAVIKLQLNQVEAMVPVMLEMPSTVAPRQRARIEVPQMIMHNLHERFRWPADQVLLLSLGVVATPDLRRGNGLTNALMLPTSPARADALLFIEGVGKAVEATTTATPVARGPTTHHSGRY
ncbi:MAG: hypothetical protein A2W31_12310 [Planctomycetes bacterium RBG_16_64_10]|nr:MAG: hypothetical protein A2W31_12310 [Planctomycetes bacterium RBG_16_64_10]